jgi:cytochrome c oxidase cbb3-type subunit 3
MIEPNGERSRLTRGPRYVVALIVSLLTLAAVAWWARSAQLAHLHTRLLRELPDAVARESDLVRLAVAEARPLYLERCASCHGADLQGNPAIGTPNLADRVWMYGDGSVFEIERTILYGIRSTSPKGHRLTDMPPFGLNGTLTSSQVRDVTQYVLQLSGRPHDGQAALAGRDVYAGPAGCFDCHGPDGRGNTDYGAPDLTANVWNSGGDPDSLYKAIYDGQHRVMPGWLGTLSLGQIRALAVYLHAASHPSAAGPSPTS